MALTAVADASSPQNAENNLQPFFVLHKASLRKSEKKSSAKTRRRIDLSSSPSKSMEKSETKSLDVEKLRMEAFSFVWSKIDSTIKDVLKNTNINVFNEIERWVHESFQALCSLGTLDPNKATCAYPTATDATFRQLFTALVFTRNMELVDDILTFRDLGLHLKSRGCYAANLSSLDFSAKNGIGGCLRSLFRQLLMVSVDVADISILALWYSNQVKFKEPIVVIIDDMERCSGSVLSEFILMLSEWIVKIPVILIMGIATTIDAPRNILSSDVLHYLLPCKFILGSPAERMDAVVEAVLVKQCCGFSIAHKVASFLRNYFSRQDGTLTSFIRALKIAIAQHFSMEPLSFLLTWLFDEDDAQYLWSERIALLPESMLKKAADLPSCKRNNLAEPKSEIWAQGLSELKRLLKLWSCAVMCLCEAGKFDNISLFDLYCEALDPEQHRSPASDCHSGLEKDIRIHPTNQCLCGQHCSYHKNGFICKAIRKVRDLTAVDLCLLLKSWARLTDDVDEIHEKVKELQSSVKFEDDKCSKYELTGLSKRHTTRSNLNLEKDARALNEKAATLIGYIVRNYMQPIECVPFHEIVCFKNVDKLQSALIGNPRRRIQDDLLDFHKFLKCSCCCKSGSMPLPAMHDTSIMYTLAQEHGDLINLHDWFQSFKATISEPITKGKRRLKHSPSPKKIKDNNEHQNRCEASVQARFCRAVMELQIAGLLRMPSKRRPDYVQRVAFGL